METAKSIAVGSTRNIIQTTSITATKGTMLWMQKLYESGAVIFWPEGQISIQPEIRDVIKAMHAILAGGKVELKISYDGGERFLELERLFDESVDEVNTARVHRNNADDPLPVSP